MKREGALRGRLAAGFLVVVSILSVTAASASAATVTRHPHRVRIGAAPYVPAGATLVAGIASVHSMQITVALKPRHPAAMRSYALAVANSGSLEYHDYLSPAQFRARYAPTAATVRRVEASLRAHGLRPGKLSANGLALGVHASGAAIEKAFSVSFARVRLATGQDATFNTQAPAVDATIAGDVEAVIGMDGLAHSTPELVRRATNHLNPFAAGSSSASTAHAVAHVATGGPQPCTTATAAANGELQGSNPADAAYTADQIATAYSFPGLYQAGDKGTGVTVALYELESNLHSDISAFQSCYGTRTSVSYVKVDHGPSTAPDQGGREGSGEAALDIEQIVGLAPRVKLLVYQGPNSAYNTPGSGPYDTMAQIVSQDRASVVSTSWGDCEPAITPEGAVAESYLFEEAAIQGQTIVSAAGDSGAEDCYDPSGDYLDTSLEVDDPASQPFVTGAGGSTLDAVGPAPTETVWNGGISGGAGGGGVSALWWMPGYQRAATSSLNVIQADSSQEPCAGAPSHRYCREVPDISGDADPDTGYMVYWGGNGSATDSGAWQEFGGTSAVAPMWAAVFALSDEKCRTRVGFANGALYKLAGQSQSSYFNDVTTGNNDMTNSNGGLFPALTGYDMATGLGTPIVSSLAGALCGQTIVVPALSNQRTFKGVAVRLQAHARPGTAVSGQIRFEGDHLPAGLKLDSSTGRITGKPTTVGTRTVRIYAENSAGTIFGGTRFTWTVQARPTVRSASLTAVATGAPRLALSVVAGRYEPAWRTIKVRLPGGLRPVGRAAALRVLSGRGHALRHSLSISGRTLTIRLVATATTVKLVFGVGSLHETGGLIHDAGVRTSVGFVVTPTDTAGGRTTLHESVLPRL